MPCSKCIQTLALLWVGLVWLAPAFAAPQPPEHLVWRHVPLSITLKTGRERILRFPGPVKLGLPPDIHARMRAQIVGDTLYLLARKDFPQTRVIVKRRNGAIYLIDLAANVHGGTAPVIVTDAQDHRASVKGRRDIPVSHETTPPAVSYVALTRFAAQALYAPRRVLANPDGYTRVPLNTKRHVDLIRNARVNAEPLIGWQAGGLYLTAVKLTNRSTRPTVLDPRQLRGHWCAATFQHARLLPRGSLADTTAVYLISAEPFAAALANSNPWHR
jgi:integrating conjugative element protein (TIGR03749 family)